MSVVSEVYRRGGVVRTSALFDAGFTVREMRAAFKEQRLHRPLRGWVALVDAQTELLFAATFHVVLTCLTQAQRLGLWVAAPPEVPHVAVHMPGAKVRNDDVIVHWQKPWVPRHPYLLADPIENVLQCVQRCQPFESALVVWESAMNRGLIGFAQLESLPLSLPARQLLAACTPFSDSGLESIVFQRLRWLNMPVRQQAHVLGKRVDLLIGRRLVVQLDGATHTGAQRDSDIRHDAKLRHRGYSVLRVSYRQVMYQWDSTEALILQAIAHGLHT